MAKRPDSAMKSRTALNINEFILFDMLKPINANRLFFLVFSTRHTLELKGRFKAHCSA